MSGSIVLVPIHLDALYVKEGRWAVPPMADFSQLPYFDGESDANSSTAYLSEAVVYQPFQDEHFYLDAGIHLHWALPDALTKASYWVDPDRRVPVFPPVPDHWLVTQGTTKDGSTLTVERQWVVESNYLYPPDPPGAQRQRPYRAIPYRPDPAATAGSRQPFRYLGRTWTLTEWRRNSSPTDYLPQPLTAVGYGEPSFAAFYPNCHGIFGFFDGRYGGGDKPPDELCYEIIGWYGQPDNDYLPQLIEQVRKTRRQAGLTDMLTEELLTTVLREQCQWSLSGQLSGKDLRPHIVCYGRLRFKAAGNLVLLPQLEQPALTLGNTVTEALAARLAHAVNPAKKAEIEEQLESVLLASRLEHLPVDIGPKFKEVRHEKGFVPVSAGLSWVVRPPVESNPDETRQPALWPAVADSLNKLNQLQEAYNQAQDDIESLRRQLFSDWYKYLLCAYPPEDRRSDYPNSDEVRLYIERQSLPVLQQKIAATGEMTLVQNPDAPLSVQVSPSSPADSLARRLKQAVDTLNQQLAAHPAPSGKYLLQPVIAPSYWQPTEPAILLTGKAAQVSQRHGHDATLGDGGLQCHFYELKNAGGVAENLEVIRGYLATLDPNQPGPRFGIRTWTEQPWHPFLLEWEIEITPFKHFGNQQTAAREYKPDFIKRNFTLKADAVDLTPRSTDPALAPGAYTYRGLSLLTPFVADHVLEQLQTYLEQLQQEQAKDPQARTRSPLAPETLAQLQQSLRQLQQEHSFCLAQILSGFNAALLMHKQTLQMAIDDPIGFAASRAFADRIRDFIGSYIEGAPQPLNDFSPIRTGELKLLRLRLVDTFGQIFEVPCYTCCSTETLPLREQGDNAAVLLPPRLVQPARLQFRWLSADSGEVEMNAHPDTTPICGWVVANHWDQSLFVYTREGEALGYLEVEAEAIVRWRSAPGQDPAIVYLDQIDNPHLRRFVNFFLRGSAAYFTVFLQDLEQSQKTIKPASTNQHGEIAFLMGQPLALVRASLSLELQGTPAIHQGWNELLQDITRNERETDGFTRVLFPIRLGEVGQLNDGLTVYWQDTETGYKDNAYYLPYYEGAGDWESTDDAKKCDFLYQSIDSSPLTLTLLLDPRGVVHATAGILPTKAISIPPQHYVDALKRIDMNVLIAPLLVDRVGTQERQEVALPIASVPGYTWSWLHRKGSSWREPLPVKAGATYASFASKSEIVEGWLKLARSGNEPKSK